MVIEWRKRIDSDLRAALLPTFEAKVTKKATYAKPKDGGGVKKVGTREARIAGYVKREEVEEAAENARQIEEKERTAQMSGTKFDVVKYSLDEIIKENASAGNRFRELFLSGNIGAGSLKGLFASGPLSRKIFLSAVDEFDFAKQFGQKEINVLARFISFIGPKGRRIDIAKRMIQSKRGEEIFRFLEKNALIETHHGGGDVVYLARAGYSGR